MLTTAKASVISWIGIVGGALTLVSNIQGIFTLAQWANWLTSIWDKYVVAFWKTLFGWFDLHVAPDTTMQVTMSVFVATIAIGARLSNEMKKTEPENWPVTWKNIFNRNALHALILYLCYIIGIELFNESYFAQNLTMTGWWTVVFVYTAIYAAIIFLALRAWPLTCAIIVIIALIALNTVFRGVGGNRFPEDPRASLIASEVLASVTDVLAALIVLGLAPPKAFTNRLIYVFVGVGFLLGLSEMSKSVTDVSLPAPAITNSSGSG